MNFPRQSRMRKFGDSSTSAAMRELSSSAAIVASSAPVEVPIRTTCSPILRPRGQRFARVVEPILRRDGGESRAARAAVGGEAGEKGVGAKRARQGFHRRRDVPSAGGEAVDIDERQRRADASGGLAPNDGFGLLRLHVRLLRFALTQVGVDVGGQRDRTGDIGRPRREGKQGSRKRGQGHEPDGEDDRPGQPRCLAVDRHPARLIRGRAGLGLAPQASQWQSREIGHEVADRRSPVRRRLRGGGRRGDRALRAVRR